jgi:hypothetical protein
MKTQTVDGMNVASPGFGWFGKHLMGFLWALGSMILPAQHAVGADGLLENPGFESDFAGWTVSGNAAVRFMAPYRATEGARLVAFNTANTAPNGVLSQTFNTVPGQTYGVSFALGVLAYNRNTQVLGVDVRGTTMRSSKAYSLTNSSNGIRWVTREFQFTADSARSTLTFRDRSTATQSIDLLLDAVMIVPPTAHTLTVDVNPTAAELVITPPDQAGDSNGNAGTGFGPLSRTYTQGTEVTVTVPELLWSSSYPDKALVYRFTGWTLDGNPAGNVPSIRVMMNGSHSLLATYAPSPPIITRQPEDVVVPYGGTATFTVEAIGSSDMNYEWKFTGGLWGAVDWTFQNGPSNTTVHTTVGSDYLGLYEVIVSNAAGSVRSRQARMTVVDSDFENDGFEYGTFERMGHMPCWTATGNVRAQATSNDPNNRYVAAFNAGNSVPNGSLEQPVATKPGTRYMLSFDLGAVNYTTANRAMGMGITVTGTSTLADVVIPIGGGSYGRAYWERRAVFFTADSEVSHIRFTDRSTLTKSIDMLLDTVRIEKAR